MCHTHCVVTKNRAVGKAPSPPSEIDALVRESIARIADRWTMEVLEVLEEQGTQRFSSVARHVPGISQKMLTQTLRDMEREGLVSRTVHPVIPPHVDYALTPAGLELAYAFCDVWRWAEKHVRTVQSARKKYDARSKPGVTAGDKPARQLA